MGLSGAPADPWLFQMLLPLQAVDGGELHLFGTTSITGRNAVGRPDRRMPQDAASRPRQLPDHQARRLGGFKHRDEQIGRVMVPAFPRVGKAPKPDVPHGDHLGCRRHVSDEIPW